jgi:hypothetical protein
LYATAMPEQSVRCCPRCSGELLLVNVIPPFGERPKILVMRCADCDRPALVSLEHQRTEAPAGRHQ